MMRILVLLLCLLPLAACSTSLNKPVTVEAELAAVRSLERYKAQYVVGAGDVLDVVVDRLPELSRTVTVRGDGAVSYPKAGEIALQGLTVTEAQRLFEEKLAARVLEPEVTVIVQNPPPPMVYVAGEVGAARPVALREAPTAAAAVVQTGGFLRSAAARNVVLLRLDEEGYLNALPIRPAGPGQAGMMLALQNTSLKANDLILVQESSRSKFTRALNDFVTTPLGAFNQLLSPYIQLEFLRELNET
jgi:polysaccharide export outer membrane protein